MKSTMLVIARTDAESGKLISSTVDVEDHEFIKGTTVPGKPLAELIADAEAKGASGAQINDIEKEWTEKHHLMTFSEGKLRRGHLKFPSNPFSSCGGRNKGVDNR